MHSIHITLMEYSSDTNQLRIISNIGMFMHNEHALQNMQQLMKCNMDSHQNNATLLVNT